jgi:hypothetical protein
MQNVQTECAQQFGQNATAIGVCVKQQAATYISSHAMTLGLNDTFFITLVGCALCILIALAVGRDPNVERIKEAASRNEKIEAGSRSAMAGE